MMLACADNLPVALARQYALDRRHAVADVDDLDICRQDIYSYCAAKGLSGWWHFCSDEPLFPTTRSPLPLLPYSTPY